LVRNLAMLLALLIGGLLVHRGLDDWYRYTVHGDSLPERRERERAELLGGIDTLVLGDSHALSGVEPPLLGAAYDLALPGQFPPLVHAVLASELDGIERVVLQADLHTLWPHPQRWFALRYYAPFTDFSTLGRQRGEPLSYAARGWLGRSAPYVGRRSTVLGYLAHGRPPELGWVRERPLERGAVLSDLRWIDLPADERARVAAERAELHFHAGDAIDAVAETYLVRALQLARARGVGVVVVQYPVSPAYLAAARARVDVDALDRRLAELLAAHPEVRRLDARDLFFDRPERFADPDHINRHGARELTQRIRSELEALEASGA